MNKQLIIECLQYFPLLTQFKIIFRNKTFKLLMKSIQSTLHFSLMLKNAIQKKKKLIPITIIYVTLINLIQRNK